MSVKVTVEGLRGFRVRFHGMVFSFVIFLGQILQMVISNPKY